MFFGSPEHLTSLRYTYIHVRDFVAPATIVSLEMHASELIFVVVFSHSNFALYNILQAIIWSSTKWNEGVFDPEN